MVAQLLVFGSAEMEENEVSAVVGRKCWRRLFTVSERATVGLWPIEERLGVVGSMRVESGKKKRGTEVGGARGRSLVCLCGGKVERGEVGLFG
ncbi:hypothetical protein NC653_040963 [Populus alba x Populus x berolinensis]|uniref:Uncharacterized protein n=1 Tax=Populus alba x Populus x berolinensis TaxID=444605 RepID=A0AAD6PQ74_9ROSI|nr:hypothetical protein NC653_040963 [Populus alba x Populus x berolinensis]